MNRIVSVALWAAALALVAAPLAWAQDQQQPGQRQRGQRGQVQPGQRGPQPGGVFDPAARVTRAINALNLDEAAKAQVDPLVAKWAEDLRAANQANAEQRRQLFTQMREAQGDQAKLAELREKLRGLMPDMAAEQTKLLDQLKPIIGEEKSTQLTTALAARGPQPGAGGRGGSVVDAALRLREQIKLTDDQVARLEALRTAFNEAVAKIRADGTGREAQTEAVNQLRTRQDADAAEVLTAEQLAEVRRQMAQGGGAGGDRVATVMAELGLSEDQQAKITEIRTKFAEELRNAQPDQRRALFQKLQEDIGNVLTAEQKTRYDQAMQRLREGGGRGGPQPGAQPGQRGQRQPGQRGQRGGGQQQPVVVD